MFGKIIKMVMVIIAVLTFILATVYVVNAGPPILPVGIAGEITINGEPIPDGYSVIIKNLNSGETVEKFTKDGFFVAGLSAVDGDEIEVSISYNGKAYSNTTVVNTSRTTQWINITIIEENGEDDEEDNTIKINEKPVVVIPSSFTGKTGECIIFNASQCYDPDGRIVKYEWLFYDYPPFTLHGKIVNYTWNHPCNIIGVLTIYDNNYSTNMKTFSVIIYDNETNGSNNITFPSMPPVANFTLTNSYYKNNTLYVNFTSTSTDPDGYIVNWTWTIDGKLYYGENITVKVPIRNVNASFIKLNVTLLVTDNDGMYDDVNAFVTLNISYLNSEKYHLIIYSQKTVNIKIMKSSDVVMEDAGKYFDYLLPEGNYTIIYAYKDQVKEERINLNRDVEIPLEFKDNKTPLGFEILIIAFMIIFMVRKWRG